MSTIVQGQHGKSLYSTGGSWASVLEVEGPGTFVSYLRLYFQGPGDVSLRWSLGGISDNFSLSTVFSETLLDDVSMSGYELPYFEIGPFSLPQDDQDFLTEAKMEVEYKWSGGLEIIAGLMVLEL